MDKNFVQAYYKQRFQNGVCIYSKRYSDSFDTQIVKTDNV